MQNNHDFSMGDVKKKLKALWADKRSFYKRLLLAGSAMAAACFTFIFFGPIEMVAFSGDFLSYSYQDILGLMATAAVFTCLGGTVILALIKGKIFNYIVTFISAVTIGSYIQALLFNSNLGSLNGDTICWHGMKAELLLNFIVWVVVFFAFYIILYLSRNIWKKMILFFAVLLVTMQSVALIGILTGVYKESQGKAIGGYALQNHGMYEYSADHNIIVFVLDRMDFDYIEDIMAEDATILDRLDGFIGYSNAISKYSRTRPALNHILTGSNVPAYVVSDTEYMKESWLDGNRNILEDLSEQGYSVEMYAVIDDLFSDPEYACDYVSNVTASKGKINTFTTLKKVLYLSVYRYSPLMLKPFFWEDTNFYNSDIFINSEIYELNDVKNVPGLFTSTADRTKKSFKFYHFNGPHEPYILNADGTKSDGYTTVNEQLVGTLNNLYMAFDRMKELGIYKDAAIIITADHGHSVHDGIPLTKATRIGLFYKPSGSEGVPLQWSNAPVSTGNIPATIIKESGASNAVYGVPLDDVAEDAVVIREYYKSVNESNSDIASVYKYEIRGDASEFENWTNVDVFAMEHSFY